MILASLDASFLLLKRRDCVSLLAFRCLSATQTGSSMGSHSLNSSSVVALQLLNLESRSLGHSALCEEWSSLACCWSSFKQVKKHPEAQLKGISLSWAAAHVLSMLPVSRDFVVRWRLQVQFFPAQGTINRACSDPFYRGELWQCHLENPLNFIPSLFPAGSRVCNLGPSKSW